MTKQEHKYAQVLRWIADGERIQHNFRGEWRECANCSLLLMIANGSADSPSTFRLAPRTIRVNGVEVPAPERVAPEKGRTYYVPDLAEGDYCYDHIWINDLFDIKTLERGIVYLRKEDAIARAKAMLLTQE